MEENIIIGSLYMRELDGQRSHNVETIHLNLQKTIALTSAYPYMKHTCRGNYNQLIFNNKNIKFKRTTNKQCHGAKR